jgi:flavin-dependent dehydrogenase
MNAARPRRSIFCPTTAGAVIRAQHDDGREQEWKARFVVDASGRDTFLANRFQIKQRNPKHNSSAIYGHFSGARRHDGQAEGNISIFWFEHGWFWFIPMHERRHQHRHGDLAVFHEDPRAAQH